ncbi:hypothetical protein N8608_03325, partial [bacterium]|nr:hypothetical protein [bacterium]
YNIPSKCLKLARILNKIPSIVFLPTNYSKCRDIHENFFDSILKYTHINGPEILSIIKKPQSRIVNRTLNAAEIQLAVSLIKEGHNPKRLNDMLTNRLSKIKADKLCISKEVYTKLHENSAQDIISYNSLMLQNNSALYEEMQRPEEYEGTDEDNNFYFKKTQLDIIAKYISKIS